MFNKQSKENVAAVKRFQAQHSESIFSSTQIFFFFFFVTLQLWVNVFDSADYLERSAQVVHNVRP